MGKTLSDSKRIKSKSGIISVLCLIFSIVLLFIGYQVRRADEVPQEITVEEVQKW